MRSSRKLFKKVKALFSNEEMLQLFIKFGESDLSDGEQNKLNKWVRAYEDRQLMFENLKKTIEFHKQLSVANESDAKDILKELKKAWPREFDGIPDNISPFLLLRVLRTCVDQLNWEICWAMVYGNRWIRVFAFGVRAGIMVLIVLITYEMLFNKS
jgi:hypothetical protein